MPWPAGMPFDAATDQYLLRIAGGVRSRAIAVARDVISEPYALVNAIRLVVRELAYKGADNLIRRDFFDNAPPPVIGCRKGCAWCCYKRVEVSIPEAILIANEIGSPGDSRGVSIDAAADKLAGMDNAARARSGARCSLLSAEGECSVYEDRPLACRSFFSPDAPSCKAGFDAAMSGHGDAGDVYYGQPQLVGCAVRAGIDGMLMDLGLQYDDVELISAIASIRRNPNVIESWAKGENAFSMIERKSPPSKGVGD